MLILDKSVPLKVGLKQLCLCLVSCRVFFYYATAFLKISYVLSFSLSWQTNVWNKETVSLFFTGEIRVVQRASQAISTLNTVDTLIRNKKKNKHNIEGGGWTLLRLFLPTYSTYKKGNEVSSSQVNFRRRVRLPQECPLSKTLGRTWPCYLLLQWTGLKQRNQLLAKFS